MTDRDHRVITDLETGTDLCCTHTASPESVYTVLAQSPEDDDGRSEWRWFRFANGDLVLGVFPQGETYFSVEIDAECPRDEVHSLPPLVEVTDEVARIAGRMVAGIDCDQDESCVILRHFDQYQGLIHRAEEDPYAGLFPLEFDQWCTEVVDGYR